MKVEFTLEDICINDRDEPDKNMNILSDSNEEIYVTSMYSLSFRLCLGIPHYAVTNKRLFHEFFSMHKKPHTRNKIYDQQASFKAYNIIEDYINDTMRYISRGDGNDVTIRRLSFKSKRALKRKRRYK